MKRGLVLLFLIFVLAGVGYCAPTNSSTGGAAVYVENYSTVPATLYANSGGQLKLTLSNPGTESANSVTVYSSTMSGTPISVQVGNMGSGSSAITSIPFTIPPGTNGVYLVYVTIYYSDSGGSKSNQLTIPLEVSQQEVLEVSTISVSKPTLFPGDSFSIQLEITNTGGVVNNVIISSQSNSSFSLSGTTYQTMGDIPPGASRNASVVLQSSSSTPAGKQLVPLSLSYEDALHNTVTQTINVGPVSVQQSHAQMRVELTPVTPAEIGSQAQFRLTLENEGSSPESAVVDITPSTTFTPIGSSRIYFDQIAAGGNETQTILIGIDPTAAAGYYELSMNVTAGNDYSVATVGIYVQASSAITVTGETITIAPGADGKLLVKIANTGNSAIRSAYVAASSKDLQVTASQSEFLGTLNVDDYYTYQPTVSARPGLASGRYNLTITISFKDGTNAQRVIQKEVEVEVGNSFATFTGSTTNRTRSGGFRILGIDVIPIAEILVVLVVLYFAAPRVYRKYKEYRGGGKK